MSFFSYVTSLSLLVFIHPNGLLAESDPDLEKALSGLPAEVRQNLRLAPARAPAFVIDASDPLKAATHFAAAIQGDDELRAKCLYQAGKRALRQGRHAFAKEIAAAITDYRSPLLTVEIAEAISAHDMPLAEEMWRQATTQIHQLKPWQAELVASRLVIAGNVMNLASASLAIWFQAIRDPHLRFTTGAEIKAVEAAKSGVFEFGLFRTERQNLQRDVPLPGLQDTADRLFKAGLERLKDGDEDKAQALIHNGLDVLRVSNIVHAEQVIVLARALVQTGKTELAKQAFESVESILGAPPDEVARLRCRMAELWKARGEGEKIIPLLENTEKQARELEEMYQPFAFAWVAAAWDRLGESQRATDLNLAAIRVARSNVNPRMAQMGFFEISLCHAETSRHLSDQVAELLSEVTTNN